MSPSLVMWAIFDESLGSICWGLKCFPPNVGVGLFKWGLKCLPHVWVVDYLSGV